MGPASTALPKILVLVLRSSGDTAEDGATLVGGRAALYMLPLFRRAVTARVCGEPTTPPVGGPYENSEPKMASGG